MNNKFVGKKYLTENSIPTTIKEKYNLKLEDIKGKYIFENKYNLYELSYDTKVKHDVMSYGKIRGKYIAGWDTLRYLALNPDKNIIEKNVQNINGDWETITGNLCFVENKTQYYRMGFDFDYKIDKYPELYAGLENQDEKITIYIINYIIESLKETLNKPNVHYIFSEKKNSKGHHVYFPDIMTDKSLHKYIVDITLKKILDDKKYSTELIKQVFDDCVAGANGLRLWYYTHNNDYYYPVQNKSTYKFDSEPSKHFCLCLLNTNYVNCDFNLLIDEKLIYNNSIVLNIKQKIKDVKNNIIKSDDEYIEDFKTLDIENKKDLLLCLLKIINIKRLDDRKDWTRIIYMCKNYGIDKQVVIDISKKSLKFDDQSLKTINDIYDKNKIKSCTKTITLGTLIKWAKEDNLSETNKIFSKFYFSQKLDVNDIDDILLSRLNIKADYKEEKIFISNEAIELLKNQITSGTECLILKSPTGTGKTTCITKLIDFYIKNNPQSTVISIVTRRSMGACHLTAFNENNSKIIFSCYLDEKIESLDYYISSLENLQKITELYDIVILDEVNSLINYFYSGTLKEKRLCCIFKLLDLLNQAKLIVAVDANITDMVFEFFSTLNKKYYYYVNTFPNKKGVKLNIYYSSAYSEDNNTIKFCEKYIIEQYIKKGNQILILTDTKTMTNKLKLLFIKHNSKEDYYRIFNKDEGKFDDMKNINKIGLDRCIIANSKFLYGLDIKITYDEIFVIYSKTSGLQSMGALEMIQQISRARDTRVVNLLVLDPRSKYVKNQYISYEDNKRIQNLYINNQVKFHADLCKKYSAINELGCALIDIKGGIKLIQDSFMTKIHYLKTWYDYLFQKNKIDIIKLIAKDYGYIIKDLEWVPELGFNTSFNSKLKLKKEELNELSRLIYQKKKIDVKYIHFIDNLKEMNILRENYLKMHNYKLDIDLICNQDNFMNFINKKYLDMGKDEFYKKIIDMNNFDTVQTAKDNNLVNQIKTCFWFEEILKIKRFDVNNIKYDKDVDIKKIFNENLEHFYHIYKNNEGKHTTIKSIKYKINSLITLNKLQKFIADCYNHIVSDVINIKYKKIYINKHEQSSSYVFIYNNL
jgi:hypothetical protein